jgi:hypothetical protein
MRSLKVVVTDDSDFKVAEVVLTKQGSSYSHDEWLMRASVDKGPSVGHYSCMMVTSSGLTALGLLNEALEVIDVSFDGLEGEVIDGSIVGPEAGPPALAG